jgi:hypothetical protein
MITRPSLKMISETEKSVLCCKSWSEEEEKKRFVNGLCLLRATFHMINFLYINSDLLYVYFKIAGGSDLGLMNSRLIRLPLDYRALLLFKLR